MRVYAPHPQAGRPIKRRFVRRFPGGPNLTGAALAPDGRTLATAGQGQPAVLWDTRTMPTMSVPPVPQYRMGIGFSKGFL